MDFSKRLRQAKDQFRLMVSLEIATVMTLVIALAGLSISVTPTYINKAKVTEVLMTFPTIRTDISQYYMETGHWPPQSNLQEGQSFSKDLITRVEFDGKGTISYFLTDYLNNSQERVISYTATINPTSPWQNLVWVCGYAKPLNGYRLQSENLTTLDPSLLPKSCRN